MKFIPYPDKIVIKPIETKGVVVSDDKRLQEKGEVVAVGSAVTFLQVGDTVFFDSWGCSRTAPDDEGNEYYVVAVVPSTIYGKEQQV